eukprot:CAMPEP_0202376512 /NCGR_PEP_ID=MMETSP1127-20130417/6991_1 /ASSEMBLY_ACC=CAM_ASM_000462 /TAXON_ID=3047 /ORGANISM="Dunaliella tertiolecta, Strain CCMP1320" /LENGTH=980 /DNA_ID=CAMNT_0048974315 /DNA_START=38 /DNA_END=2981 /DNA_ORIENTATION=-
MSKQRNFRPRSKLALDDEEDDTSAVKPAAQKGPPQQQQQQPAAPAPKPAKAGVASKPSLLSFGEDAEGEDAGRPIMGKKKDKDRSKSKFRAAVPLPELPVVTSASQRTGAGEYTSDKLQALKQETFAFNAKASSTAKQEPAPPPEPGIKLSGSFKPAGQPKDDRFSINPTALVPPPRGPGPGAPPSAASPEGGTAGGAGRPGGKGGGIPVARGVSDDEEEADDGQAIPDEQTIKLARAKRERLRQAHLAPDYVPLGGASKLLASGGGTAHTSAQDPEAKMASDSDGEADLEDSMRIKFSAAGETATRQDRKAYSHSIGVHDEEESFASEQLRNAVRRQHASMAAAASSTPAAPVVHGGGLMGAGHAAAGPVTRSRIQQISGLGASVLNALQEGVSRLQASHNSTQANLSRTDANLTSSFAKVEQHEADMKAASEKYTYVQQMRAYMADLCDCLAHKSAIVEELEESLADLREERATSARQTARALEEEMVVPASAAVSAAMGVLGRGGAPPAAAAAAESALEEAEEALADAVFEDAPDEVDEFGRNVNIGKRREAEARRRQRRDAVKREQALLASVSAGGPVAIDQRDEWELEDEGQAARYTSRHKEIMEGGATVFADASDEFATLEAVKQRLEEFKLRYPRDYASIYMQMSTPALFAPYVRLQLLQWDPLYADTAAGGTGGSGEVEATAGFDKQAWYTSLFDFGMGAAGEGGTTGMAEDDPDADLVPQLVRKLVLPIAHHLLAKCWEPCSVRQSSAVADIVGDLCVYVPAEEEGMAGVLNSCVSALEGAVAACSLPPWPPAATGISPQAQAVLSRRFRFALRLLRGISGFEGLLSRPMLLQLALSRVVGQAMMPYLRTAVASATAAAPVLSASGPSFNDLLPSVNIAVARIEAVANSLSPEWFSGPQTPTEASPLLEMATSLAHSLETAAGSNKHQPQQRQHLAALAGRMCKALQRLGQIAPAGKLASTFGLQQDDACG